MNPNTNDRCGFLQVERFEKIEGIETFWLHVVFHP